MIELTEVQRRQLADGAAVDVIDLQSEQGYVVLRKDIYDRLRQLLFDTSESTDEELRLPLARSSAANGWDEPEMDSYDRYDEELRKRCR